MAAPRAEKRSVCDLPVPRRNRYFYAKLLDAEHFELETDYFNQKRWLLNRLVTGYGVVCGLDVRATPDGEGIIIRPGLAIDKHGREIIVSEETQPHSIPEHFLHPDDPAEDHAIHVVLCYHECAVEPAPVLAGGCAEPEPCEPGVILERYKVEFRPGCLPRPKGGGDLRVPDLVSGSPSRGFELDYDRLVEIVSEDCPPCPADPCIPLADIALPPDEDAHCHCTQDEIDITVRPIVLGNDLLFQLLLSVIVEAPSYRLK